MYPEGDYLMETLNDNTTSKRPGGMTFLLILSLINACLWIFGSLLMYFGTPVLGEMLETGQMEEMMLTMNANMDETMMDAMMANFQMYADINPVYYLFLFVLYIGSLVGVLKMFKLDRIGFHIYSIVQLLILIAAAVYLYPHQVQSTFFSDFLGTLMFILLYHLFFKRIEFEKNNQGPQSDDINSEF